MIDEARWEKVNEDMEVAQLKATLVWEYPDDYTLEEVMEIARENMRAAKAVDAMLREDFDSMPPEMQREMLKLLANDPKQDPGYWTDVLLS